MISFLVGLLVYQGIGTPISEALAVTLFAYAALTFMHRIGERIALLECISCIASLEILLVPAITYWVFPASMPIASATYFSYALPAFIAFYIGINNFSSRQPERPHRWRFQDVQVYLQAKQSASIVLLLIGLAGFWVKTVVPAAPAFLSVLPSYCLFISALYAHFSRSKYRLLIGGTVLVVLLAYTARVGMFGDLFFWLMLMGLFGAASLERPPSMRLKIGMAGSAFGLLLLIQSIKGEYRYNTWGYHRHERRGDVPLMADLLTDRLMNPDKLLTTDQLFLSTVRFNQGIMIGSAMAKVPAHEAFANGEVLLSLVYPLIPRLIWPNKPQTGGYENIRRFTTLPQSENTSINLSPLGEGYVNFGYGGIVFALLYGTLLRHVFQYVFSIADRIPSLILWLPMLYVGCLTMETDLLSTWGSLLNSAIFMYLLFGALKQIGIQL
ncbi:hypothetical protein GCM10027190_50680 [Spirosoma areae]